MFVPALEMRNRLLLILLPGVLLFLILTLKSHIGAYYLGSNQDPGYMYLLNGLNLVKGKPPGHVDNPGTTLQEVAALSIGGTYLLAGQSENVQKDVLSHPEKYLQVINYVLIGLVLLTLFVLSYRIAKNHGWQYGVFFQFSLFTHPKVVYELAYVKPESFVLVASMCFMYVIFNMLLNNDFEQRYMVYSRSLGIICGIGLISKLTFLPLFVATLFLLSKASYKQGFLNIYIKGLGRFLAFFLITCLVLGFPVLFSVQYLAHWVIGLVVGSGKYGSGELIIVAPSLFTVGLKAIFSKNIFFAFSYLALLGAWVYGRVKPQKVVTIGFRVLSFLLIAFTLQIFIVAKHYAHHYLIPVLPWSLMSWFVLYKSFKFQFKINQMALYGGAVLGIVLYTFNFRPLLPRLEEFKQTQTQLVNELKLEKYKDKKILGYHTSSGVEHALIFGIFWAGKTRNENTRYYQGIYQKLYADRVGEFAKVSIQELTKDKERFIIQTQTTVANNILEKQAKGKTYRLRLKKIYSTGVEHLYKIVAIE
ncbi:MAG TPA: hypothetical protein DCS93_02840 [Microscillaceae bacterium]|nr:hypothetical protein [Microscillaceae bacterium]